MLLVYIIHTDAWIDMYTHITTSMYLYTYTYTSHIHIYIYTHARACMCATCVLYIHTFRHTQRADRHALAIHMQAYGRILDIVLDALSLFASTLRDRLRAATRVLKVPVR